MNERDWNRADRIDRWIGRGCALGVAVLIVAVLLGF